MAKNKYIGNVFQSRRKGADGSLVPVEGEFNLCVNLAEGETLTLKKGDYVNLRTPAAHYGGLAERGFITLDEANAKIQDAIAKNVRLIPTVRIVEGQAANRGGSTNTAGGF
jgi:hypothetical protein